MIFKANTALALALIALVSGTLIYVRADVLWGAHRKVARIVGIFVMVASILIFACSSYYKISYWHQGYFKHPGYGWKMKHKKGGGCKGAHHRGHQAKEKCKDCN